MIGVAIATAYNFGEKSPIYLSGNISLAEELISKADGVDTLFITLFDANSPRPMPYAAMRERISGPIQGQFFNFMITPERIQVMNPSAQVPKSFRIKARLDRDGQGGMDQSGDLTGELDGVPLGAQDVAITIGQEVP
jgi:hypothetical protein